MKILDTIINMTKTVLVLKRTRVLFSVLIGILWLNISSCKKLVEVEAPVTSTTNTNVYSSDATAAAVLTGLYTQMSLNSGLNSGGISSVSFITGLSADELTLFNSVTNSALIAYYKNALSSSNGQYVFWNNIYPYIFTCNSAITGLTNSTSLTPSVRQQLLGEAKFLRSFFYFYLVNLYGDVPLVLTTDYNVTANLPRTPKQQVYQQIISDLKDAQDLLSNNYLEADALTTKSSTERVRPNKWVADALLARVYLYNGNLTGDASNYTNAESQATNVMNNTSLFVLNNNLNGVFLKSSQGNKEAIWQLQPVNAGWNTEDAKVLILPSSGPNSASNPVYLSQNLVNSFELGDNRKSNWISKVTVGTSTYYYPFKYKVNQQSTTTNPVPVTEYLMVIRLAELFLIRAEARAQLNNLTGAIDDLDKIRNRAGITLIANTNPNISKPSLIDTIIHERRVELFGEWGQRWLDLKRTGNVDAVMTTIASQKGGTWETTDQLYPIPLTEMQKNSALVQNPGYF